MWSVSISYGSGSGKTGDDGQFVLAGLTGNLIIGFGIFGLVLVGAVFLISIVMCIDCMRKRAKVDFQDDLEDDPTEDITKEEILKEAVPNDEEEGDELDTVSVVESLKEDIPEVTPDEEEPDDNEAGVMIESEQQEEPEAVEAEDRTLQDVEAQEDILNEDKLETASLKEESNNVDNDEEEKTTIQEILETPLDQEIQENDGDKLNGIPSQS